MENVDCFKVAFHNVKTKYNINNFICKQFIAQLVIVYCIWLK